MRSHEMSEDSEERKLVGSLRNVQFGTYPIPWKHSQNPALSGGRTHTPCPLQVSPVFAGHTAHTRMSDAKSPHQGLWSAQVNSTRRAGVGEG